MLLSICIVLVIGGLAVAVLQFLKNIQKEVDEGNIQGIENWTRQMIAKELGKKLNKSPEVILQQIFDAPDLQLISKLCDIVDSIVLTYVKESKLSDIQIKLQVNYTDGSYSSVNTNKNWDDIPEKIRSRFLRTNDSFIDVNWDFPWMKHENEY